MGVPSFYRWLVSKYPNIRVPASEDKAQVVDTCSANPNGLEFHNLYLDMNGIIHPCFHPQHHVTAPTSCEDVFDSVYEYIDRIFRIVRPRKLLFMAIDGVAPRAKMNQQRARRFRTAKDNQVAEEEEEKLREQFEKEGKPVLPKVESEVFDSNVITPGTEFMDHLSKKLKLYIKSRLSTHPGWAEIQVIISDSNVPGEGEHKIMSFIRSQRSLPGYDPNTRHCLYGLDADLIMLALATHEVHFSILREDVLVIEEQSQSLSALETNLQTAAQRVPNSDAWVSRRKEANKLHSLIKNPYEFVHIWILREYLQLEMETISAFKRFDLERFIDDFIFFCFFAGNDFLPHMPTLEIHEGGIDLLLTVYKKQFKETNGYLVDMRKVGHKLECVNLKCIERFILEVGKYEEKIFKKRSILHERRLRRLIQDQQANDDELGSGSLGLDMSDPSYVTDGKYTASCSSRVETVADICSPDALMENTNELKQKLKEELKKRADLFKTGDLRIDKVKFGDAGWKERYYRLKFSATDAYQIEETRKEIVQKYTEGLVWVLLYYFSGVQSWNWFYPFYYGPFASDLKGLGQVKIEFEKGIPLRPLDQLMAVLPPRSAHALPKPYAALMTDTNSTIIDYYPTLTEIEIDMDGKRYAWQGVCKLPLIDEGSLLAETTKVQKELSLHEQDRNSLKSEQILLRTASKFGSLLILNFPSLLLLKDQYKLVKIETDVSWGIGGCIQICTEEHNREDDILCFLLDTPSNNLHVPCLLEGVNFPLQTLTESDIEETVLWHDYFGSKPCSRTSQGSSGGANTDHYHNTAGLGAESREMHISAGSGWGRGRGRGRGFESGWWREQARVTRGFEGLSLSRSQNRFMPHGRGRSSTEVQFWRPRNESSKRSSNPMSGDDGWS